MDMVINVCMETTAVDFGFRKLQKARHSFLLPMPVDWIRTIQAAKGDSLRIELMSDNSLRITPSCTEPPRTEIAGRANTYGE